jgi:mono/diheme cytochrome c family protein
MRNSVIFFLAAAGIFLGAWRLLPAQQTAARDHQISPETVRLIGSLEGPELYKAYCAVCHGTRGRGDGPMAAALKTAPSDLTGIAARNKGVYPLGRVEKVIAGEEVRATAHGTADMPIWGPIFSQIAWDQDLGHIRMHNLAEYIGKIQAK